MTLSVPGHAPVAMSEEQLLGLAGGSVKPGIDPFNLQVLRLICENGPYYSAVTLGADLGTTMFLDQVLEELNAAGWIVYSLTTIIDTKKVSRWAGLSAELPVHREIATRIWATELGYTAAGHRPRIKIVGPKRYRYGFDAPPKGAWIDYTRFWHHAFQAVGGEIIREPIGEHIARFPEHHHLEEPDMAIDWNKNDKIPPKSNPEVARIMAEEGIGRRKAYQKWRETRPPEAPVQPGHGKDGRNQKLAILRAIAYFGIAPSTEPLTEYLGKYQHDLGLNEHNLAHLLWGLRKEGLVRFREQRGRPGFLAKIELTDRGQERLHEGEAGWAGATAKSSKRHSIGVDMTDAANHKNVAEGGPITKVRFISTNELRRFILTAVGPSRVASVAALRTRLNLGAGDIADIPEALERMARDGQIRFNKVRDDYTRIELRKGGLQAIGLHVTAHGDRIKPRLDETQPANQNERPIPVIDESVEVGTSASTHGSHSEGIGTSPSIDTPTQYSEYSQGVSNQGEYPLGGTIDRLIQAGRLIPDYVKTKFPPIWALVERHHAMQANIEKAEAFLSAAAVLEKIDAVEAERLSSRASEIAGETLSPLEVSVLALLAELGVG